LAQRRPDVRRAYLSLKAQDQRIAQAVAQRYPRLSLSASVGQQAGQFSKLSSPDSYVWNLASNLTVPIFDAGSRKAEVYRQQHIFDEQLANYNKTLLNAFLQVENGLFQLQVNQERIKLFEAQTHNGLERLELTKNNFLQGIEPWSQVILTQNQYVRTQTSLITEKRLQLEAQVDLFSAIGGRWTSDYLRAIGSRLDQLAKENP